MTQIFTVYDKFQEKWIRFQLCNLFFNGFIWEMKGSNVLPYVNKNWPQFFGVDCTAGSPYLK